MTRLILLITKPPHSDENAERMCGISRRATERDMAVAIYMIGDGVLCAKQNQKGYIGQNMKMAIKNGVSISVSGKDLRARALSSEQVEPGVTIEEDLEEKFIEDLMENADRVISW